jgi:hypothetical protein
VKTTPWESGAILGEYRELEVASLIHERFDELAKGLATNRLSRRQVLKTFASSVVAGALPFLGGERADAATCKPLGNSCTGNTQCCSKFCSGGVCRCKPAGKNCTANGQCCSGICLNGQCRCKANGKSCSSNRQCCSSNCKNGACAPKPLCGTDLPTAASVDTARSALAAGATDVALSPGGCWRYLRTFSGTFVSFEEMRVAGKAMLVWNNTSTESIGQEDANQDGFFESVTRVVRGQTTNEQRAEVTKRSAATQALTRRETYTRTDDMIHALWERDDGSGSLETEAEFDTTLTQVLDAGTLTGTNQTVTEITPQAGCAAPDELVIRTRLDEAVIGGFRCMRDKGRPDIGTKILRHYVSRTVGINCETLPNNRIAEISWWRTFVESTDIVITVDWGRFSGLTPEQQRNILWHEMLHLHFGAHNPLVTGTSRQTEIDQTYACASLCFTFNPAQKTRCSCARCLGTSKCDSRCTAYLDCNADMGGWCPCPCKLKFYSSLSSCAVDCPSGLCCFGFQCRGYDAFCS